MKISVAMAYYNGGTYIEEQMDSILSQLGEKDEVIVSVDGASDGSKPLLLKMAEVDSRIHIVKGPGKGVVRNFENAIRHCNGDIIYLSDQDDIWKPDKVEKVNYAFSNPEVKAVLHDAYQNMIHLTLNKLKTIMSVGAINQTISIQGLQCRD